MQPALSASPATGKIVQCRSLVLKRYDVCMLRSSLRRAAHFRGEQVNLIFP